MKTWQRLRSHPQLLKRYFMREKVIVAVREFFSQQKFHEIETPLLAPALPAESYIEVFETKLLNRHRQERRAFLTTSPEMFLKKLLVVGVGDCFSITKSFRNSEDLSNLHNPEFTILEWYRVGADYKDVMKDVEALLCFIYKRLYSSSEARSFLRKNNKESSHLRSNNKLVLTYQEQKIDLTPPWQKLSMTQAFRKYANLDLQKIMDEKSIKSMAIKKGYSFDKRTTWEELFHQIYLNEVTPHLGKGRPTIIYDYPVQLAALAAKKKPTDPRFVERFEVYIAGLEVADCCSELTDWKEQNDRFQTEIKARKQLAKNEYPIDIEFIEALKAGIPPCAGIALGVDRLVMLFANVSRIQDTLFFPAEEMWNEK